MRTLLGLRQKPGALALAVFRIVPAIYRLGLGRILGRTFLMVTYKGRSTGQTYRAALMVLGYDRTRGEVVSLAMYGAQTGWLRNIIATPALAVDIRGKRYQPLQRLLSEDEAVRVVEGFRRAHPFRVQLVTAIMGWGRIQTPAEVREFVRSKPFVAFRPASIGQAAAEAV